MLNHHVQEPQYAARVLYMASNDWNKGPDKV